MTKCCKVSVVGHSETEHTQSLNKMETLSHSEKGGIEFKGLWRLLKHSKQAHIL